MIDWNDIIKKKSFKVEYELKKGFTNNKYVINVDGKKYLFIEPKNIENTLIDFELLATIYPKFNTCDNIRKILYFNPMDGKYICEYLENHEDNDNKSIQSEILIKNIKEIHNLNIKSKKVDWILEIEGYISKLKTFKLEKIILTKLQKLKQKFKFDIDDEIVFSHGDLTGSNILVKDNEIKFIDFEYCCNTYKMWDITYYCFYQNFTREQSLRFVNQYYNEDKENLFDIFYDLVLLVSVTWAAMDYELSNNEDSLKQYKDNLSKLERKGK